MNSAPGTGLVRAIGRWDLAALAINNMIGAGIFGLPSEVFSLTGTYSLLVFLICAAVVTLIVLCFAEVGSRFTDTGGAYLYARKAFGAVVGFEVGWLIWLSRLTGFAAVCHLLVNYLGYFWPAANSGPWRAGIITVVIVALTVINILGVRDAAVVSNFLTVGKLVPLLIFIVAGLFVINPYQYPLSKPPDYRSFSTAALILVFAFVGFESAVIPAGEVRDPQRNIAFALLTAIGAVALIYFLIQLVCIGVLPELADSERPLADASRRVLGAAGGSMVTLGVLIAVAGTLHIIMLVAPRLPFAMAEQGQLPRILAATHPRFHTPYAAILLSSAIMLILALSGTFLYALTISTMARLLTFATTCAALPVMRRSGRERQARFTVHAGVLVAMTSVGLCGWLLSNSGWRETRDLGIAAAAGLLIHVLCRSAIFGRRPGPEEGSR
jgi:amino acid transporter